MDSYSVADRRKKSHIFWMTKDQIWLAQVHERLSYMHTLFPLSYLKALPFYIYHLRLVQIILLADPFLAYIFTALATIYVVIEYNDIIIQNFFISLHAPIYI